MTHVRLVFPHQLFEEHLDAERGTVFVLVEDDLFFRQYAFHTHKLVLHRASMRRFAGRLRESSFDVELVDSSAERSTHDQLVALLTRRAPQRVTVYDVVDDWLLRNTTAALEACGLELGPDDVPESPNFLTTRAQVQEWFGGRQARMQHFYQWQRTRLDILMDGTEPAGGRWSFDTENRKKLPRGHAVPTTTWPERHGDVDAAIDWVRTEFSDNPGDPGTFIWPTTHEEARRAFDEFLEQRLVEFGPYEDAVSVEHPFLFHSVMTPGLNIGLLSPDEVVERALTVGGVDLPSLEGFVRQVIGWREYMRATYVVHGRRMRSSNHLGHTRRLAPGWWTAETGLDPVDHVIGQVLERGWAHHIERLMVLGNAMCLLRTDPDDVYEWFMEMFVDAYDWVMVPNVYAMSQFAAGTSITTKPYVSGSNYLRKMTDFGRGEWDTDWDGLYWTFVRDHREVFESNPRARMMPRMYDALEPATKAAHTRAAARWLG